MTGLVGACFFPYRDDDDDDEEAAIPRFLPPMLLCEYRLSSSSVKWLSGIESTSILLEEEEEDDEPTNPE